MALRRSCCRCHKIQHHGEIEMRCWSSFLVAMACGHQHGHTSAYSGTRSSLLKRNGRKNSQATSRILLLRGVLIHASWVSDPRLCTEKNTTHSIRLAELRHSIIGNIPGDPTKGYICSHSLNSKSWSSSVALSSHFYRYCH